MKNVSTDDLVIGDQATRSTRQPQRRRVKGAGLEIAETSIVVVGVDVTPAGPHPLDRYRWLLVEGVGGSTKPYAALRNQTWAVDR